MKAVCNHPTCTITVILRTSTAGVARLIQRRSLWLVRRTFARFSRPDTRSIMAYCRCSGSSASGFTVAQDYGSSIDQCSREKRGNSCAAPSTTTSVQGSTGTGRPRLRNFFTTKTMMATIEQKMSVLTTPALEEAEVGKPLFFKPKRNRGSEILWKIV